MIMAVMASFALQQINRVEQLSHKVTQFYFPLSRLVDQILEQHLHQSKYYEQAYRHILNYERDERSLKNFATSSQAFTQHNIALNNSIAKIKAMGDNVEHRHQSKAAQGNFAAIIMEVDKINLLQIEYKDKVKSTFEALDQDDLDSAALLARKIQRDEEKLQKQVSSLHASINDLTQAAINQVNEVEASAQQMMVTITVAGGLVSLIVCYWVLTSILHPLTNIVSMTQFLAHGDLSTHDELDPHMKDEIGAMFSSMHVMIKHLHRTVTSIWSQSVALLNKTEELSIINENSRRMTSQQKERTDLINKAIGNLNEKAMSVTSSATNTSETADRAYDQTSHGQEVVQDSIKSIEQLAASVKETGSVIQGLEENSEAISGILDVIRNIADQTNLLALNAAIEAARAGEQGRGFAVVADEVRTLAQRTQDSTQEIEAMIDKLQSGTRNAVMVMSEGESIAGKSVENAVRAGTVLDSIKDAINNIKNMSNDIAEACRNQNSVTSDIVNQIYTIQENATQCEQHSQKGIAVSDQINELTQKLQNDIHKFKF